VLRGVAPGPADLDGANPAFPAPAGQDFLFNPQVIGGLFLAQQGRERGHVAHVVRCSDTDGMGHLSCTRCSLQLGIMILASVATGHGRYQLHYGCLGFQNRGALLVFTHLESHFLFDRQLRFREAGVRCACSLVTTDASDGPADVVGFAALFEGEGHCMASISFSTWRSVNRFRFPART